MCGGFDGTTRHLTMEFYDQPTDKWNLLESTSVGREGAGLVSLGDSLYCIGGYDGIDLLKSVERYDFNNSTWSSITSMITPRSGAGCAALNYRIFVCGGKNEGFYKRWVVGGCFFKTLYFWGVIFRLVFSVK